MSIRILLAGLLLLAPPGLLEAQVRPSLSTKGDAANPTKEVPATPRMETLEVTKQHAAEYRDIRDLDAQEAMAKWAFWMLVVAACGTALSFIGIFLVWRTLLHTRRAADFSGAAIQETKAATAAAISASEAATESNAIMRETTDSQLRAYVGPDAVTYTYNAETGAFAVSTILKNFGQTPAYKYRTLVGLNFIPFPILELPEISGFRENTHTLFPTMTTQSTILLPASPDRAQKISKRQACFFMTIICEYEDHRGQKHSEKTWCYVTGIENNTLWTSTHTASMTFHAGEAERRS